MNGHARQSMRHGLPFLLAFHFLCGCDTRLAGQGSWRGQLRSFEGLNAAHGPAVPAAALHVESGPGLTRPNTVDHGGGTPFNVNGWEAILIDSRGRVLDPGKYRLGRRVEASGFMQLREVYAPDGQWISKGGTGSAPHWLTLRPKKIRYLDPAE